MRKRLSWLTLALILIAGIAFLATPGEEVNAAPKNEILRTYYSDATYTTEIGFVFWPCVGSRVQEGETSPYVIIETESCS